MGELLPVALPSGCPIGQAPAGARAPGRRATVARPVRWAAAVLVPALLTAAVAVGAAVATARPATATEPWEPQRFGLHLDSTWYGDRWWWDTKARDAAELGATVARHSLLWHLVEPDPGAPDWSRTDAVVAADEANGMATMFAVLGSPSWANGRPASLADHHLYVGHPVDGFTAWVQRMSAFAYQAASRYRGRVEYYEVWNEANEHWFWRGRPVSVAEYAHLFASVHAAIRLADPSARVAIGSFTGLAASGPSDIDGLTFLRRLADEHRWVLMRADAVAVHPYDLGGTQDPTIDDRWDNNFTDIRRVHELLASRGLAGMPLWVSEWGWSSAEHGEPRQAYYLVKALVLLATRYPYVTLAIYFHDRDTASYAAGLRRADGTPKLAATYARAFGLSRGCDASVCG